MLQSTIIFPNKAAAGYHMLMILSVVDGQYAVAEGKIIVNYLVKNYTSEVDTDKENAALLTVPKDQVPEHFKIAAGYFLDNSTEEERIDFIAFAYRLILADGRMAIEENKILTTVAYSWNIDISPLMDEEKIKKDLSL
jgi:hypothetical protein